MTYDHDIEIAEVELAEVETLVRMQEGCAGNDEDSKIAEKW